MRGIALILLLANTAAMAEPQRQTFRDANGRECRNTGRSVTSGGTTIVYDQMGRQTGTIRGSK